MNQKDLILAIDIGGSKYMVGLVDIYGNILVSQRYTWQALTQRNIIDSIIKSTNSLLRNYNIKPSIVGVTIPGLADPSTGYWIDASFSGIKNFAVGSMLETALGIPVFIDNDGQACALAEKLFGSCKDVKDFLYLTVSNGIGGAIFTNNKLYVGDSCNAGEFGHCAVVEDGRTCKCGNKGCLEVYAAGPAIAKNFIELGGPKLIDDVPPTAKSISNLARVNDSIAIKTFDLEGYYLGKVIATASNILNPKKVILGGGVSLSFPLFEKALRETVNRFVYRRANQKLEILPTPLGYNGGLLGAAAVAICARDKK